MADLVGMAIDRCAMRFGEPDGGTEMIDVCVREQDRAYVFWAGADSVQRLENLIAMAGITGVDEHHTGVAGDDSPVHQGSLRHVNALGDSRQRWGHVGESIRDNLATL